MAHPLPSPTWRSALLMPGCIASMMLQAQVDIARSQVNPFIGTGGHGHTFPGACVPNGLVQLSPDTRPDGVMDWDGCGGYHYSDSLIYGFSHTHLSGTGVADLCDVLVMPMSGVMSVLPEAYRTPFRHATEETHAGYYKVHLDSRPIPDPKKPTGRSTSGIDVELTATARAGVHRYTFPQKEDAYVVIDLVHRDQVTQAELQVTPGTDGLRTTEITGSRRSSSWAKDQQVFFCMQFSAPAIAMLASDQQRTPPSPVQRLSGNDLKGILNFGDLQGRPLIVKVGISAVSIEGARKNLEAEVPGWDFDAVRSQAEAAWNAKLGKVQVEGGTPEQQRVFYTALYHCYVAPYVFNDVDGRYRGMDGQVHQADHNVYTVFSLWDTFRGLHPLMTILEPDMTADWIKTFLLHYQQGGRLPVWELWGNETDCMIGYHSVSVIADAYRKGIRGFDAALALKAMEASALRDEPGLNAYRRKGYISSEDQSESVSRTLEYAYDDGCIARFRSSVTASGDRDTVPSFYTRSGSHEHLYDPATGFFRARRNGGFVPGFDPYEVNFNFTEANAWQYSLFVPQDVDGLIRLHGGAKGLEAHLDKLFSARSATTGRDQADITGLIGQYAHGNEPSHHMAYLYNRVGRPDRTRALVKRILDELYHDAPDGLSGNEDCGQMSAWYVLSALGFYPISPGIDDRYELGHPLFEQATILLPNGKTWRMKRDVGGMLTPAVPRDPSNFIREVPDHVRHNELMAGGSLVFDKEGAPYERYRPKQFTVLDAAYLPEPCRARPGAPVIEAEAAAFSDSLAVSVIGCGSCTVTEDGATRPCRPGKRDVLHRSASVSVDWSRVYEPVTARFTRTDGSRSITLESTYANQYAAGGDRALVDGLRGGPDFRTGEWQGFQGQDVLATIDLGAVKDLERAGLSMLQDQRSWIWFPGSVEIAWSMNGRQWSSVTLDAGVDRRSEEAMTKELWSAPIGKKARFIKVVAHNAGPCPDWHPGKGGASWIFLDEVLLEVR